jgi:hypothetical protein
MKHLRLLALSFGLLAASSLLGGCLVAAPLPPPHVAVAVSSPYYYDGFAVYYDGWGVPYYYDAGVVHYVPRTYVHYDTLLGHYRAAPYRHYAGGYRGGYRYHGYARR